ncbi:bifunctional 5,10-methylenetetrahydrofolate dehydrogenase/5,10-methenyltetrahydrofolate cyclohydrolase [Candidatus Saccharibacteria bacterium]|nr:bifunctional 5,10-methylenetetrahydrofolate dehydrogenase/5,10-methenyltetrahydrofolate cyclohydrolase [Candidatus Saccharibacteria bacterium]
MKILNGRELAGFIKERQSHQVASLKSSGITPKLLILRDSDDPVIMKYVNLKKRYGEDIGVDVIEFDADSFSRTCAVMTSTQASEPCNDRRERAVREKVIQSNSDPNIHGIIIQLPLTDKAKTDELCNLITPEKDVDGLGQNAAYDSATATAILWLLAGYDIPLQNHKIALVGRGKLVGAPLYKMLTASSYDVTLFHRGDDLTKLINFDIIISATGTPGLILDSYVKPGATIVDAGTASEGGVLKGDVADSIRARTDLAAITPTIGGVGPLTITCLFDHLLQAATSPHA